MLDHWQDVYASEHNYKVIQFIGSGGNSRTYHVIRSPASGDSDEAVSKGVGGNFALKLAHPELSEERIDRFESEQEFLSETNHPAILPFYDKGTFGESPFMVIEYLPHTLEEIILSDQTSMSEKLNYATGTV